MDQLNARGRSARGCGTGIAVKAWRRAEGLNYGRNLVCADGVKIFSAVWMRGEIELKNTITMVDQLNAFASTDETLFAEAF